MLKLCSVLEEFPCVKLPLKPELHLFYGQETPTAKPMSHILMVHPFRVVGGMPALLSVKIISEIIE